MHNLYIHNIYQFINFIKYFSFTDILLCGDSHYELEVIWKACRGYLDAPLDELINQLLFGIITEADLEAFIQKVLHRSPNMITENIRRMNAALREDAELKNMKQAFMSIYTGEKKSFEMKYGTMQVDDFRA